MTPRPPRLSSVDAIIAVGRGRGFLTKIAAHPWPLVITAAHCLPTLPRAYGAWEPESRTYKKLLGPLGAKPTVAAECLFVDPVGDVAVLSRPDYDLFPEDDEAFMRLFEDRPTLRVGALRKRSRARVLSLANEWQACSVAPSFGRRQSTLIDARTADGMSGSPIVTSHGTAVGLVRLGSQTHHLIDETVTENTEQLGQPYLVASLPGWLLSDGAPK